MGKGIIPLPLSKVWAALREPHTRFGYDSMLKVRREENGAGCFIEASSLVLISMLGFHAVALSIRARLLQAQIIDFSTSKSRTWAHLTGIPVAEDLGNHLRTIR